MKYYQISLFQILLFQILLFQILLFPIRGCRILSLSGGGAHGAFQGGVLNKLHDIGRTWNIITGISAGALNGMMLGMFKPLNQQQGITLLEEVWLNITTADVYKWNWNPIYDQSLMDNSPLNRTVNNIARLYGGLAQRDIIVGAVNFNTGLLRLFNRTEFSSAERSSTIVMASASIPGVFPPTFLDGNYYVDGGTFSNELIRPAIQYCRNKGYADVEIEIDLIICSPPIQTITNKEIESDYIFGIGSRAYDILFNAISNHELYSHCNNNQKSFPLYVYKPYKPYAGGLLDFNHKDIVEMFNMGYNIKNPTVSKYCY